MASGLIEVLGRKAFKKSRCFGEFRSAFSSRTAFGGFKKEVFFEIPFANKLLNIYIIMPIEFV
jgi:hypothetical protein